MAWLIVGGALLVLAPLVGAAGVAAMLALTEHRVRTGQMHLTRAGRRASTHLFEEYLEEIQPAPARRRAKGVSVAAVRRADTWLLVEHLDERAPRAVPHRRPVPPPRPSRAPRPTRLVPLTA